MCNGSPGFAFGCGLQIDLQPAFFDIGRERDDAVAERADKNFLGIERADKGDIDVTAAFKVLQADECAGCCWRCWFETSYTRKLFPARS